MSDFIWINHNGDNGKVLINTDRISSVAENGNWTITVDDGDDQPATFDVDDAEARRVTDILTAPNPEDGPWANEDKCASCGEVITGRRIFGDGPLNHRRYCGDICKRSHMIFDEGEWKNPGRLRVCGRVSVYCEQCQKNITGKDFEMQAGYMYCPACADKLKNGATS